MKPYSCPWPVEIPHLWPGEIPHLAGATGTQLLFRFVAAAYERRALGVASHWAFNDWGRFLPEHTTTASLLDRLLHHAEIIITDGDSYRIRTRGGGPTP